VTFLPAAFQQHEETELMDATRAGGRKQWLLCTLDNCTKPLWVDCVVTHLTPSQARYAMVPRPQKIHSTYLLLFSVYGLL